MSNAYLGRTTEIEAQTMFYTVYRLTYPSVAFILVYQMAKNKGKKIQCLTHLIPNFSLQNKCMDFIP